MIFRLLLLALCSLELATAQASSDMGYCYEQWVLESKHLSQCNNQAFLSPANDTRVNMKLLLNDLGQKSLPAWLTSEKISKDRYPSVPFYLEQLDLDRQHSDISQNYEQDQLRKNKYREDLRLKIEQTLNTIEISKDSYTLTQPRFAYGEGTRCQTNTPETLLNFIQQLIATDSLSQNERKQLAERRISLLSTCGHQAPASTGTEMRLESPQAQAFSTYLDGIEAFYQGDFRTALELFSSLTQSDHPWLKETGLYLLGRTSLNSAQQSAVDEYGISDPSKADRGTLNLAKVQFETYIQAYPNGLYTRSANGLLRRILWLSSDVENYSTSLLEQLNSTNADNDIQALVDEYEQKRLPFLIMENEHVTDDPLQLAILDLRYMRTPYEGSDEYVIEPEIIESQKKRFSSQPDLHSYLTAVWLYYHRKDATAVIKALPGTEQKHLSFLTFSIEMLRGMALEKLDRLAAQKHWLNLFKRQPNALQRTQLEFALALNYERSKELHKAFANDSLIQNPEIRERLLSTIAGPEILRQQVTHPATPHEQRVALYTLLYKDLLRGGYSDFSKDLALINSPEKINAGDNASDYDLSLFYTTGSQPNDYSCPTIVETADTLSKDTEDAKGLLCLGDFVRKNGLDYRLTEAWFTPTGDQLGGTQDLFPGATFSRLATYIKLISSPQVNRESRAYALFRAINCFASSGNNSCDRQEIEQSERKQWFQTLKRDYRDTHWAKELKYYW